MAYVPITLPVGQILLYGNIENRSPVYNIRAVEKVNGKYVNLNWCTVSQVYDGATLATVGQSVAFNGSDLTSGLKYGTGRYYMISEAKIVTIE